MSNACLEGAKLIGADLAKANLTGANLMGANLNFANLNQARLSQANLSQADLRRSALIGTYLEAANLTGCKVFGTSIWRIVLSKETIQSNLVITEEDEPAITVDNLEVAQFIYLLLHNAKIRDVIDTITSKAVLILGRFTPERKSVLESMRQALRARNYLPILFDFDKPASRDITETVSVLAHMARFIIADITDAKSIPQELGRIVPSLPSVPVQPLLLSSQAEYSMFEHFRRYPWVLAPFLYEDAEALAQALDANIIGPAEAKAIEQRP